VHRESPVGARKAAVAIARSCIGVRLVAIPEVDVVPHADLVPVVDDGVPGMEKRSAVISIRRRLFSSRAPAAGGFRR
jgi:hypothetical protein